MKSALAGIALLVFGGCASTSQVAPPGNWSAAPHDDRYPFSEIEKVYETVLTTMLPRYFGDDRALANQHQKKMEEFVRSTFPPSKFCDMMVRSDGTRDLFERAQKDRSVLDTPEFHQTFEVTVDVSVQMAMIIFAGRFDTYGAKFIHPSETTRFLFSLTNDMDEEEYISWVSGEVAADEARNVLGAKLDYREGDRFFMFSSPDWYWQQLAGRQGYLQVRNGKIIGAHITMLN